MRSVEHGSCKPRSRLFVVDENWYMVCRTFHKLRSEPFRDLEKTPPAILR